MSILGNMAGCYSPMGKTFILTDERGTELTGVVVGQETVFTATADDIKIGKIAATNEGITEGVDTKTYRMANGRQLVSSGSSLSIPLSDYNQYNYTKLQCMIAPFNTSVTDSVAINQVVIDDCVYNTGSISKVSYVTKNNVNKSIDLNITNNTGSYLVIHFFTYKEEV